MRSKFRIALAIWILIVTTLLLSPGGQLPSHSIFQWPHSDKVVHLGIFTITSLLVHFSFDLSIWSLLLIGTLYGFLVEIIQINIPGRSFELLDLVSDVAGTLVGSLAFTYFNSR